MELNAVETFLKTNGGFASIHVLRKQLQMNKKQVRRLIMNSTSLRAIDPLRVGSGKKYLSIFEYSSENISGGIIFFKHRKKTNFKMVTDSITKDN